MARPLQEANGRGGRGKYRVLDGDVPIALFSKMTSNLMDLTENVETGRLQTPGTNSDTTHPEGMGDPTEKLAKFRILSWNVSGMKDDSIDNIVLQLRGLREDWDAILVQEGPRSEESS